MCSKIPSQLDRQITGQSKKKRERKDRQDRHNEECTQADGDTGILVDASTHIFSIFYDVLSVGQGLLYDKGLTISIGQSPHRPHVWRETDTSATGVGVLTLAGTRTRRLQ